MIKVSELSKGGKDQEYAEKVRMAYEKIERLGIRSVEEDWKVFRDAVLKFATEVCGWRQVVQGIRKGIEWWNDKVRLAVLQKRKIFEQWLQQGTKQALRSRGKRRGR